MPHIVTLNEPHISIEQLDPTTFPDFAILTGVNGSGKSHFLEGLKAGAIRSDAVQAPQSEILLSDWSTIVPNNLSQFSSAARL